MNSDLPKLTPNFDDDDVMMKFEMIAGLIQIEIEIANVKTKMTSISNVGKVLTCVISIHFRKTKLTYHTRNFYASLGAR